MKDMQANKIAYEEEDTNRVLAEYANAMAGSSLPEIETNTEDSGDTNSTGGEETDEPVSITTVTTTDHETITGEDDKGNQVVIPGGFKLAEDSGTTVQEGIVIEDADGNQFVWIPVSNTNGDGSNPIILDDGSEVEITLGRYTFDISTGEETLQQYGSNYATKTTVESYYYESSTFQDAYYPNVSTSAYYADYGASAVDLAGFVTSVSTFKGYYIARFEACRSSDYSLIPASKKSTSTDAFYSTNSYAAGTLIRGISQPVADASARFMYERSSFVKSDLMNSFAWDTAISYFTAMGYPYAIGQTNSNVNSLLCSGSTGDEVCKVYDMAGNLREYTTETSSYYSSSAGYHAHVTIRGLGYTDYTFYSSARNYTQAITTKQPYGFRVLMYVDI